MNQDHAVVKCCLKRTLVKVLGSKTGVCKDGIGKSLITDGESAYLKLKRGILGEQHATWMVIAAGLTVFALVKSQMNRPAVIGGYFCQRFLEIAEFKCL